MAFLAQFVELEFAATIVFCCLIPPVQAADGEDEVNNLFSDLAPLLALFGEQVAKQFLSESMGWADDILFAIAPLGVITGVVSAIRVGGPTWLKAVIGRAREGRANVELELMSSNSLEVGEMWNGQTIVRVLGTPSIFQLLYSTTETDPDSIFETDGDSTNETHRDPAEYIKTLNAENGFFKPVTSQSGTQSIQSYNPEDGYDPGIELRPLLPGTLNHSHFERTGIYPPNISLNARGEPVGEREKWAWALISILTQITVLVYQALITFDGNWMYLGKKGEQKPSIRAFLLTAIGTISLTSGMFICSYVVESASTETDWVRTGDDEQLTVAWIQKGATVGDQVFDPYLIFGHQGQQVIRTSQRSTAMTGVKVQYLVLQGTFITVAGFIIQFSGLRGMNWTATVVQLAAIGILTIVRSIVRRRMSREPTAIEVPDGHELDCMARKIGGCDSWKVIPEGSKRHDNDSYPLDKGIGHQIARIRGHLGDLTQWPIEVQHISTILCSAIEKTMDHFYQSPDIQLIEGYLESNAISWRLGVLTLTQAPPLDEVSQARLPENDIRRGEIIFKLSRSRFNGEWQPWAVDKNTRLEMMAVLSLSLLRIREEESDYRNHQPPQAPVNHGQGVKVLRTWPRGIDQHHFRLWMGIEGLDLQFKNLSEILLQEQVPSYRVIGNLEPETADGVSTLVMIPPDVPVQELLAQQLFSDFFSAVVQRIKIVSGSTRLLLLTNSIDGSDPHLEDRSQGISRQLGVERWQMKNSALDQLVEIVYGTELGGRPQLLMSESTWHFSSSVIH